LTRSNPSATSIAAGVLESMMALSSSMAVLSDDLEFVITKNTASTSQAGGSSLATGVVPSTAPPTTLASTTSGSAASATGAVTTPTPFQAGMIGNCTKFHLIVSGDTCSSIATAAGISLSDFYTWNPAVGTTCATLFADNNVCIGVGSSN
jgi:LysM repeat protein